MPDPLLTLQSALSDRYRLERELGQGGMATVYLAEDLKHGRKVAIKVLHPELSAVIGGERFLAEIKLTASLQHPHILGLIDSGVATTRSDSRLTDDSGLPTAGLLYYVMPFIEGETLRGRLAREKQLPVDDSIRLAREVAAALEFAHKRGIIHRDIKPENILLQDGAALVADFGIALAVQQAGGSRMTQTGMSLGTPAYMSPEQAMGERDLGPRSDVYALGAMTYEMLTGEPPFTGPNSQAIVAKVLTEQPPPLRPRRPLVPSAVENTVLTALQKLPADRFGSARDFADALDGKGGSYAPTLVTRASRPSAYPPVRPVTVAISALLLTAAGFAGWMLHAPRRATARFQVTFPAGQQPLSEMRFTPDGSLLVYVGPSDTGVQLWVKKRDELQATPLAGTRDARSLAISPDGQEVAFVQDAQLKRMRIGGGAAAVVADSVFGSGVAWLDNGTVVYTSLTFSLMQRPVSGGAPRRLWKPSSDAVAPVISGVLAGGRAVYFSACTLACSPVADLWAYDFKADSAVPISAGIVLALPIPGNRLAMLRSNGTMIGATYDPKTLRLVGLPSPILPEVQQVFLPGESFRGIGLPGMALSAAGDLMIQSVPAGANSALGFQLVWMDRSGKVTPVDTAWSFYLSRSNNNIGWSISPDGSRVAIGLNTSSGDDIWIKQLPSGPLSRLTFDTLPEQRPHWTPDGRSVTYIIDNAREYGVRRADGTGSERRWKPDSVSQVNEVVYSPDNQWIVARIGGTSGLRGPRNIYAWRVGDSVPVPLMANPNWDESSIALSPDGKWLAYVVDETGRSEVYIRPFPNVEDGKWQVSAAGGQSPIWAHSGKEIFYVDEQRNMVAIPVTTTPAFHLGAPRVLFHVPQEIYFSDPEFYTLYDISRDDSRFLMARSIAPRNTGPGTFLLIQNWFAELNRADRRIGG